MNNVRLHVRAVQAELAEGNVSVLGRMGRPDDRPIIESARQAATKYADEHYAQSELAVNALCNLYGGVRVPPRPLGEAFSKGFADGVGRFVLADCRLHNTINDPDEPISVSQPEALTGYMFRQYLGFNKRLGGNGLTPSLLGRSPFVRHPVSLFDDLLRQHGEVLNEYTVRKTFLNQHAKPGNHLREVENAYVDMAETFPEAAEHTLKQLAFKYPYDEAIEIAEGFFGQVDELQEAFPDIARHIVETTVLNSREPRDKLVALQKLVERLVVSNPKMPPHIAQELVHKHPRKALGVSKTLEAAVESIFRRYPNVLRDRLYHIGSWYGSDKLDKLVSNAAELAADYARRYRRSEKMLCQMALESPENAEERIREYLVKTKAPLI